MCFKDFHNTTPSLTLCASVIFLTPQLQHTTTAESQSSLMALLAKFLIIKDGKDDLHIQWPSTIPSLYTTISYVPAQAA